MDIVHSLPLLLEKSGDCRSRDAVAQFDLATYYDRVPTLLCARRWEAAGVSPALLGTVVRQQLATRVSLGIGGVEVVDMSRPTSGALTASRVAGRIGRWPVEQAVRAALRTNRCLGWAMPSCPSVVLASYVDNLYGVGNSAVEAAATVKILRDDSCSTRGAWPSRRAPSRWLVVCRGTSEVEGPSDGDGDDGGNWITCGWCAYRSMNVLGHHVAWGRSSGCCWQRTAAAAWRKFYAITGTTPIHTLPLELRLRASVHDPAACSLPHAAESSF